MNVSQWDFLMVWIFTHDSEKVMGDIAKFVGWAAGGIGLPFPEIGESVGGEGEGLKEKVSDGPNLRCL